MDITKAVEMNFENEQFFQTMLILGIFKKTSKYFPVFLKLLIHDTLFENTYEYFLCFSGFEASYSIIPRSVSLRTRTVRSSTDKANDSQGIRSFRNYINQHKTFSEAFIAL